MMPAKLPVEIKSLVIQQWLQGKPRINEWRQALGFALADGLRELAVTMKKVGITAAQCALGFRATMIMNKIGVKEDEIEYFITDILNRCNNVGFSAQNVAIYLQDVLEFSTNTKIPISKIEDYLKEKARQNRELEQQIEDLKQQIQELDSEWFASKKLLDEAIQKQRMTASDLQWYSDLKTELGGYGIPVDDISKLRKTVNGIRDCSSRSHYSGINIAYLI